MPVRATRKCVEVDRIGAPRRQGDREHIEVRRHLDRAGDSGADRDHVSGGEGIAVVVVRVFDVVGLRNQ